MFERSDTYANAPARARRRVDASMDLLNEIFDNPIDPDYHRVAAGPGRGGRSRLRLAAAALGVGLLFSLAGVRTSQHTPVAAAERADLLDQVAAGERRSELLRETVTGARAEVRHLRALQTADDTDRRLAAQLEAVAPITGAQAVTGPGLVVVADDGTVEGRTNRVLDRDLQQLVNALWECGAEAIAINGHRLTSQTAIRGAGESITVDYRSLVHPYRVEAIGEPRTLAARLGASSGGRTWARLHDRYGLRYDVSESREMRLPEDPGMTLRHARRLP